MQKSASQGVQTQARRPHMQRTCSAHARITHAVERPAAVLVVKNLPTPTTTGGEGTGHEMTYPTGSVKQNPDYMSVAVRTNIPDPKGLKDWCVATVDRGGHYATEDQLAGWVDVPT